METVWVTCLLMYPLYQKVIQLLKHKYEQNCNCTFSLISSALLQRGSASLYLPLLPYNTARLLRVAATAGWSFPSVFSLMAKASFRRWAASLYLFWSLEHKTQSTDPWRCVQRLYFTTMNSLWKASTLSSPHLYTRARMLSIVATSGWSCPDVFSRSSRACLHSGTATSYLPWEAYWITRLCSVLRRAGIS